MANISINLNLRQYKNVLKKMKKKDGSEVECLIIPIESNGLIKGEKGVYANLTAIEIKNKVGDSKDTHLIKQDVKKEVYENLTDEEKKAMPIMGNAILWKPKEADPVQAGLDMDDNDDLPF